ncbi:MAG: hypothetical protein M3O50_01230 [Myxococcota bacterium]|nr:hypothetical protein [Myxococcota bacterium]
MASATHRDSYEEACFRVLAYEIDGDDAARTDRSIRRKLARDKLGPYSQARVDYIRSLKNDLQKEIRLYHRSQYYLKSTGPVASTDDFDFDKMVHDYAILYPDLGRKAIAGMIAFALYLYYLR